MIAFYPLFILALWLAVRSLRPPKRVTGPCSWHWNRDRCIWQYREDKSK
jgi:hypothetical protein